LEEPVLFNLRLETVGNMSKADDRLLFSEILVFSKKSFWLIMEFCNKKISINETKMFQLRIWIV